MIALTVLAAPAASAHSWGWHWWMPFALAFWIGVAATAAYLMFRVVGPRPQPAAADRAKEILAERLARGEITPDEYYERLSCLS